MIVYYRKFEKANEDSLTGPIQECFRMFKSEPMFKLLTTFTGLNLSNVNLPCKVEETNKRNSEETAVEDLVNCFINDLHFPKERNVFSF